MRISDGSSDVCSSDLDPRRAGAQQLALNPAPPVIEKVREHAAMAVAAPPAEAEIEGTAESERRQPRLRLLRQRPRLKAGAAERELGSLNADQTDFPPVGEREGIAVDHRDRLGTRGDVEVQSLCTVRRREIGRAHV